MRRWLSTREGRHLLWGALIYLALALAYNVVALPLAAGVLAPWGILLTPALGALFMSASTIIVAINAQLLRGLRFTS